MHVALKLTITFSIDNREKDDEAPGCADFFETHFKNNLPIAKN